MRGAVERGSSTTLETRAFKAAHGGRGRSLNERQLHPKRRAFSQRAFDADPAAHRFDEVFGKRQPESGAFDHSVADIEALKGHEGLRQIPGGNTTSGVRALRPTIAQRFNWVGSVFNSGPIIGITKTA